MIIQTLDDDLLLQLEEKNAEGNLFCLDFSFIFLLFSQFLSYSSQA